MYRINSDIMQAYDNRTRDLYLRATFNDTKTVNGDYIISYSIDDILSSDSTLTLGNCCSSKLTLSMYMPDDMVGLGNAKVEVEIGIELSEGDVEYSPLGVFYVDKYTSGDDFKSVDIVAYDGMLGLDALGNSYSCKLAAQKVTAGQIIRDVASQAGIETDFKDSIQNYNKTVTVPATQAYYNDSGVPDSQQNEYMGISNDNLVAIPANSSALSLKYYGFISESEPLRVCYFADKSGKNLIAVKDYSAEGLKSVFQSELELGEDPYEITPSEIFENDIPETAFYLGLCFKGDAEVGAYITVDYSYTDALALVNTNYRFDNPGTVSISPRKMVGYMAGLLGGNAKMTRDGKLGISTYNDSGITITPDTQLLDGIQKSVENELSIGYLVTGVDDNQIIVGTGNFGFNFSNPYIQNETAAQNVLKLYEGIKVLPCKIEHRGNPALESSDIITVSDVKGKSYKTIILSQKIDVDGGLSVHSECSVDTNAKADFISTPTNKSITAKFDSFVQKYQGIMESLTGISGGYVKFVYDSVNKLRAIAIPDADVELKWDDNLGQVVAANGNTNTKMWVWSNGGLGYTNDGGKTYEDALTKDGQIWAKSLLSFHGTIGGWNIDDNCLYADYGNYRTYIQAPWSGKAWAFSTQTQNSNTGKYEANYTVTVDGEVTLYNRLKLAKNGSVITDAKGVEILSAYRDGALVLGYGYYENNYKTWVEGHSVNITTNGGLGVRSTFTFNTVQWDGVAMPTLQTNSDLFINVPDGKAIFLQAPGDVYVYGNFQLNGDAKLHENVIIDGYTQANGTVTCLKGLAFDDGNYIDIWKEGSVLYVGDGQKSVQLNSSPSGVVNCKGDLRLKYYAASGTVPLVLDTVGNVKPTTSSKRYKENITEELEDSLNPDKLYDLPVVQYNYKPEYKDNELVAGTQIGVTAEGVAEHYPNACIYNENGEPESWQDRIMIPAMLKLIQEQKQEIEQLKLRLDKIEKEQGV